MIAADAAASRRLMREITARDFVLDPMSPGVIVAMWTRQPARASSANVPAHVISMSSGWAMTARTVGIGRGAAGYFSEVSVTGRPFAAERSAA